MQEVIREHEDAARPQKARARPDCPFVARVIDDVKEHVHARDRVEASGFERYALVADIGLGYFNAGKKRLQLPDGCLRKIAAENSSDAHTLPEVEIKTAAGADVQYLGRLRRDAANPQRAADPRAKDPRAYAIHPPIERQA